MDESSQYEQYIQPSWAPPSFVFGPVWSVLYTIIFVTFGYVFYKIFRGELPKKIALPFILNLIFNAAFTPIQFGLSNNLLASIDIILVLITIIWFMMAIYKYEKYRWIVYTNIPYLLWVSFATVLQFTITFLNA